LLQETGKMVCRSTSTPVDPNAKLENEEDDVVIDKEVYKMLVGTYLFISH